MNKFGVFFVLVSVISTAHAHDFWLEPGQFHYDAPTSVPIQFKVGHHEDAGDWALNWEKIVALRNYTPGGVADMAASVIPKSALLPGAAKTHKLEPGSYVIGFESYHSLSSLEAEKFNRYVQDEGLTAILNYRQSHDLMNNAGTEIYSRKAKSIVQIGSTFSDNVTQPIGLTLEIVPLQHPASLEKDGKLPVQVLFRGKPLENALIDASALADAKHKAQSLTTDSEGKTIFTFPEKGAVKLNVIWGVPAPNSNKATFETYFSSLTFAVDHTQ